MYAKLSAKKILVFGGFVFFLAICLVFLLNIKRDLPAEYFSIQGLTKFGRLPLESLANRFEYLKNEGNPMVAAAIEALGIQNEEYSNIEGAREIPVLLYHGIVKDADRFSMTPETFKEQMFALKKAGYQTVKMDDFLSFMKGEKELPARSFLLTFDDGRADSYYGADPVLQALGYSAVMFVATDKSVDRPNELHSYYLPSAMLRRMASSGRWEIGSHAVQKEGGFIPVAPGNSSKDSVLTGNFLSNKKWLQAEGRLETDDEYKARLEHELGDSKSSLEKSISRKVPAFSYPFGDFGQQSRNDAGSVLLINDIVSSTYDAAFRQVWPNDNLFTSNYPGDNMTYLHRVEPATDWKGDYLVSLLQNTEGKPLPYSDSFETDNGWKKTWGDVEVKDDALNLKAAEGTTGAFTFLDGTADWKDYIYAISADWKAGSHLSLLARLRDRDNYVSCVFGLEHVRIEEKKDGVTTLLFETKNPVTMPPKALAGMSVQGSNIRCYRGTEVVAYSFGKSTGDAGGIGLQIWDSKANNAEISIRELEAKEYESDEKKKNNINISRDLPGDSVSAFRKLGI